jgi:hypothetical protein
LYLLARTARRIRQQSTLGAAYLRVDPLDDLRRRDFSTAIFQRVRPQLITANRFRTTRRTSVTNKDNTQSAEPKSDPKTGAPDSGQGIKSRLTDAQREMLASKSRGGAGSKSVSHGHKPTQASGTQGPAQKKVRW